MRQPIALDGCTKPSADRQHPIHGGNGSDPLPELVRVSRSHRDLRGHRLILPVCTFPHIFLVRN
jgi:hypothetical protein